MVHTDETDLWHKRLGHVHYQNLYRLSKRELIIGLPKLQKLEKICGECQIGKQTRNSHKKVNSNTTTRPLELLHMDLIGPTRTESRGGKKYILVIVDDFTRYTWVAFLRDKSETLEEARKVLKRIQIEKDSQISKIRSDHGSEFENSSFEKFCSDQGILHEFSAPKTPQQNGIVERKNRVLQEMANVMLNSMKLSKNLWAEAVNTACYIINRVFTRKHNNKTAYELWFDKKPTVKYFRVFGSKCYILRDRENLGKFDTKSDEGIFLGYSLNSRAYRVLNKRTGVIQESINVVIDDQLNTPISNSDNDEVLIIDKSDTSSNQTDSELRTVKDHPTTQILGNPLTGISHP